MLYELICNGMNKSKWYESERWNEIKRENVSWSPPIDPTAYWALISAPWSGEPNSNPVGGPLSHSTHKRRWGWGLEQRGWPEPPHPPKENPNPILKSAVSDGMCPTTAVAPLQGLHRSTASPPPRLLTTVSSTGFREAAARRAEEPEHESYYGSTVTHREVHTHRS